MLPHNFRRKDYLRLAGWLAFSWTAPFLAAANVSGPIVELNEVTDRPIATRKVPPEYPAKLRSKKIDGSTEVEFVVTTEGRVSQTRVVKSTHPEFEGPTLKAIAQWKFTPGKIDGRPVNTRMYQEMTYSASAKDTFEVVKESEKKTAQAAERSLLLDRESFIALLPPRIYVGEEPAQRPIATRTAALKTALKNLGQTGRAYVALPPDAQRVKAVKKIPPEYPMKLRRDQIAGEASFLILIGEDGEVYGVCCTSSTHPLFALHGGAALIRWKFEAPQIKGTPVPILIETTVVFSLAH